MPKYRITDSVTGKTVVVSGDGAPSEQEAEQIFADAGVRAEEPSSGKSGIPLNATAGANDLIATAVGAPVDAINYAMHHNPLEVGVNAVSNALGYGDALEDTSRPMIEKPVGGSQWIKENLMGAINANPDEVQAGTTGERIARSVGSGAAGVLLPGGAVGGLRRGLAIGAGAGAGSGIAHEIAPDSMIAPIVGGLAGGVGAAAGASGVGAAARAAPRAAEAVKNVAVRPFTEAGREHLAGQRLAAAATDEVALRQAVEAPQPDLVTGSKPTTFQQTGDLGVGGLENQMRNKNNAPFLEREAQQNSARTDALEGLQPTGEPTALSGYIRERLRWLDEQTQADVDGATNLGRQRAEALGGARQPEEYGQGLRGNLRESARRAKLAERQLWDAVDPQGDMTISPVPLTAAARNIQEEIAQSARPIAGEEAAIFQQIGAYGEALPFRELIAMRGRINAALRVERRGAADAATLARLSRLRGAIENATTDVVEQRAAEAPEVMSGLALLERQATQWSATSRSRSQGIGADVIGGEGGVSASPGTGRAGFGRPGAPPGDQSLSGQPAFDEAARERLTAATAATREYSDTYGRGQIGKVLKPGDRADLFRVPDSEVPKRLFRPGNAGAEDVRAFRQATADPDAFRQLQDYAASDLRRFAANADGTLDARKIREWTRRHQSALREFPDDLRDRITNAQTAGEIIERAAASRKAILNEAEGNRFAEIAGLTDADDVQAAIGSVLGSGGRVAQMQALARVTANNPEARQGLRRAVAQFMARKLIGNTEAATSGKSLLKSDMLQSFVRNNEAALSAVFSPEEIQALRNIAADLQRANRNTRVRGQSATAQNVLGEAGGNSMLGRAIERWGQPFAAGSVASQAAGPIGFVAAFVAALKRQQGMARVDELVTKALLEPEFAKKVLARVPTSAGSPQGKALMREIERGSVWGAGVGAMNSTVLPSNEGAKINVPADSGVTIDEGPVAPPPGPLPQKPTPPQLRDVMNDKRPLPQMQRQYAAAQRAATPRDGSRALPADAADPEALQRARDRTNAVPSTAQAAAGNYAKGKVRFNGLTLTIETAAGGTRSGVTKDGEAWSSQLPPRVDYGYLEADGADGDKLDVFLGPATGSQNVTIIDQLDDNGKFDEHKILMAFRGQREAESAYAQSFSDGKGRARIGGVSTMPMEDFKALLRAGAFKNRRPLDKVGVSASKGNMKEPTAKDFDGLTNQIGRGIIPRVGAQ